MGEDEGKRANFMQDLKGAFLLPQNVSTRRRRAHVGEVEKAQIRQSSTAFRANPGAVQTNISTVCSAYS